MTHPRSVESGRRSGLVLAGMVAASAALLAQTASAAPVTIYLHYTTISGTGTADGTVVIDDSLLAPNAQIPFDSSDFSLMTSFTPNVAGLPGSPTSTSFGMSDLNGWVLDRNSTGHSFDDLNFFMDSNFNTDGYQIQGVDPLLLEIRDEAGAQLAVFRANPSTSQTATGGGIPTLSTTGLVTLSLLIALGAGLFLARRVG